MKNKLPNFLIVGASRSGTTSLYHYLSQHPEVYMSPVKEPRFITAQFLKPEQKMARTNDEEKNIVNNFEEYKALFTNVNNEKAIGEASADNLYFYEGAIQYIRKYLGDVKIIIILRNPVEKAYSHYLMYVRDFREHLSFEEALRAEKGGKDWRHYENVSFYYKQVKAYLENFTYVKVYLHDDLKKNPLGLARDMYEFLGVDTSFNPDLRVKFNISGVPRNKLLHGLLFKKSPVKNIIKLVISYMLPEIKKKRLIEYYRNANLMKPQMKQETRQYLKSVYKEDVLKLQSLIEKDLKEWLV